MFDSKRTSLYSKGGGSENKKLSEMNIIERFLFEKEHETVSGNGSVKLDTTGNIFVDDMASVSLYREPRTPEEIFRTVDSEWNIDPDMTLRMAAYIRAISRNTSLNGVKTKVNGQGLRHEYFFRLFRIASKNISNFEDNFAVLTALGSVKDVFDLWRIQLEWNENIIPEKVFLRVISAFLAKDIQTGKAGPDSLALKYLPTIRPKSKQTTLRFEINSYIGRAVSDYIWGDMLFPAERRKAYRILKSSGTAHDWQQKISKGLFDKIDWNRISGKALTKLANSGFLRNHGLEESFRGWIKKQDTVKTTSYPFDLVCPKLSDYQVELANRQFMEQVLKAGDCAGTFLTAIDVSGSMESRCRGLKYSSIQVAYAMAAYFSKAVKGPFSNAYVTFSTTPEIRFFGENETPYECVHNHNSEWSFGSTDFLSVIDILCRMKTGYGDTWPESVYPSGILCISDGEFNNCGNESNFVRALGMLREAGFSEEYVSGFTIVLWDIPNTYYGRLAKRRFETLADIPNFFHMSGLDPSGIAFLTQGVRPKTPEELLDIVLNQPLLKKLTAYR